MKTLAFDYDNVPGIASMYAVPVSSSLRDKNYYTEDGRYQELIEQEGTISIPVYDGDSFMYSENQTLEDGGELWTTSISGLIPKQYKPNEQVTAILERGDWLVLFQDKNGAIVFSGTVDVPFKFNSNRSIGSSSEINGNRFTFNGKSAEPSSICS